MSVMIVTSLGDIVIDLFTNRCPLTCKNFLKLCKIKYYNGCLFHTVQKDFIAQTGDPTGTANGGDSIYKFLYGDQARFFSDELHLDVKHSKMGTVAMASAGEDLNASQFYITLHDDLDYLDGKHTVFGEVAEGLETLARINDAYVDVKNRPFKNIRIKHTYILDDPYDDPPQLAEMIPDASPDGKPKDEIIDDVRLEDDWVPLDEQLAPHEVEELLREKDARSRAVVLETIGDIPDAEIKPPDSVLFVCKLNPVTEDDDLHTIFSRFGVVTSAEVIRDHKTGDSLCYAFIEFKDNEACEQAYFKMDNALIDDRRIHVDFSQSVAKLWSQYHRKVPFSQGRGCYKCGSLDHIANNCTGENSSKQPLKFVLKDDNTQRGGDQGRSYEMLFGDEDDKETRNSDRRSHKQKQDHHRERQDRYYSEKRDSHRSENERLRRHHEREDDERYAKREGNSYRDHTGRNGSSSGKDRDATHPRGDDRDRSYDDDYKHKPRRNKDSEENPRYSREKEAIDDDRRRKNMSHDDLRDDQRDRRRTTDDARYIRKERGGDPYSDRSYKDDDPRDRSRRRLT